MFPGSFGSRIRSLREKSGLPIRIIAASLDLDPSTLSKIERGERRASRDQVIRLTRLFKVEPRELLVPYLSDRVLYELQEEEFGKEVLRLAEEKMKYATRRRKRR